MSEQCRKDFGEASEKLSDNKEINIDLLSSNYEGFVNHIVSNNKITSEELRRNFGETSDEFRTKYGDGKALLLFIIALKPKISAKEASKMIGVSDRTVETYLASLKETILERVGSDKGGYWKILITKK
tara:strand:+ start:405 stop:788 length:384 start_codon:yes stop_codon:yes gene_type:complete